MRFFSHYYIFLFLFALISCKKDIDQIDQQVIEQYILDNNLVAESTTSGLHYIIDNQGSGDQPNSYSTVTIASLAGVAPPNTVPLTTMASPTA